MQVPGTGAQPAEGAVVAVAVAVAVAGALRLCANGHKVARRAIRVAYFSPALSGNKSDESDGGATRAQRRVRRPYRRTEVCALVGGFAPPPGSRVGAFFSGGERSDPSKKRCQPAQRGGPKDSFIVRRRASVWKQFFRPGKIGKSVPSRGDRALSDRGFLVVSVVRSAGLAQPSQHEGR